MTNQNYQPFHHYGLDTDTPSETPSVRRLMQKNLHKAICEHNFEEDCKPAVKENQTGLVALECIGTVLFVTFVVLGLVIYQLCA
jgi:hypothetical protein